MFLSPGSRARSRLQSLWKAIGKNIYFLGGNVGIGTSSPAGGKLVISGTAVTVDQGIRLQGDTLDFRAVAESATSGAGWMGTFSSHPLRLYTNSTARAIFSATGLLQLTAYSSGTLVSDATGNITLSSIACNSGQLTFTSTTALAFKPCNGDTIKINGVVFQIPTGGIAGLGNPTSVFLNGVAAQTLVAGTTYFIYAFSNSGTVTADFSTTGHSTSGTAGNVGTETKTGDDGRTLIGMVRTGGTVIYAADLQTASWFNRRNKSAIASGNTSGASGTMASISFVTWGEENIDGNFAGSMTTTVASTNTAQAQIDGGNVGPTISATCPGGSFIQAYSSSMALIVSEGFHTYQVSIGVGAGGTTTPFGTSVMVRG